MSKLIIALISFVSFYTFAEDAPIIEKPAPSVGDVYEYSGALSTVNCKKWETIELNKNGHLISQCGDYLAYLSAENNNPEKITNKNGKIFVEFKPFFPGLTFPLSVGKKWSGKYEGYTKDDGARWNGDANCEVKAYEEVKTDTGTLNAFRIECADNWRAGSYHGIGHSTRWYAPEAKSIVKVSHQEDSRWNLDLTAYSLK